MWPNKLLIIKKMNLCGMELGCWGDYKGIFPHNAKFVDHHITVFFSSLYMTATSLLENSRRNEDQYGHTNSKRRKIDKQVNTLSQNYSSKVQLGLNCTHLCVVWFMKCMYGILEGTYVTPMCKCNEVLFKIFNDEHQCNNPHRFSSKSNEPILL